MKKKLWLLVWTAIVWVSSIATPLVSTAAFQNNLQNGTNINVSGSEKGAWTWFIDFVQKAVNWILGILWLITVIVLIWGGFQMVTAAWDDGKYKKWFTIVKQSVVGLILIGVSWLIVSLIFSFVWNTADNTTDSNQGTQQ